MRIKLDENLPAGLVGVLADLGHDVHTVASEGLGGKPDASVWGACLAELRFFITQDLDFSDIRRFEPGTHPGILVLRLARPGRVALSTRVSKLFESEQVDEWNGCFVVATDRKLRVRKPRTR